MLTETEILQQALELPAAQREAIAQRLLDSLKPDDAEQRQIDEAWAEEIERRATAYERGEVQALDASEVFERAYRTLRRGQP